MISGDTFSDFLRNRDQQHTGDRVADKSRYDLRGAGSLARCIMKVQGTNQYDPREHQDYRIQRHIRYDASNHFIHYNQQPAARYPLSESYSTHRKENHGP